MEQSSITGSSEGHTAYFYKRAGVTKKGKVAAAAAQGDALFKDGLDLIGRGTLDGLYSWVKEQIDSHFTSPRPARRRRSAKLFANEV